MTCKSWSSLKVVEIKFPALRSHTRRMAHVIQHALSAFTCSLCENGHPKSWVTHKRNRKFRDHTTIDIGDWNRLHYVGNVRFSNVSAMKPGIQKIAGNEGISRYFESVERDLHIVPNACCVDYAGTCSSKQVHRQSKRQSANCNITNYIREHNVGFDTGVAWVSQLIMRFQWQLTLESNVMWLMATIRTADSIHYH
jgi:hypothetical protein